MRVLVAYLQAEDYGRPGPELTTGELTDYLSGYPVAIVLWFVVRGWHGIITGLGRLPAAGSSF